MDASSPTASVRAHRFPGALIWLLPAALTVHAIAFWGTGLLDREGSAFIIDYLADRPIAAAVFDPWLNDWGTYQARELSYFVDYLDAQVFAALFSRGMLWLIPTSGVIGLFAIIALYLRGARDCWRLDRITTALLLSWFLSTIVVQSSTAIYYRSAKVLVAVCLASLALLICRPLTQTGGRVSFGRFIAITMVASAMTISDRQGFFFVAVLIGLLALWTLLTPKETRPDLRLVTRMATALLIAFGWGALYNYVVGPQLVHWLNEYWPDFSYQEIDARAGLTSFDVWDQARVLVTRQFEFLTGGRAFMAAAVFGLVAYLWRAGTLAQPYRSRLHGALRDGIVAVAAVQGLLVMTALMVIRHPYVYTIPDHSYWYYFLPAHVLFLIGVSAAIGRVGGFEGWWRYGAWTAIVVMIAGNVFMYPAQRRVMVTSEWVKYQVARTDVIKRGWEGLRSGTVPEDIPRWVSVESTGARLRLPVPNNDLYPDTVRAALTTRAGTPPLDQATGPHWGALRDFFLGSASPLLRLDEWPTLIEALRSIGIREIAIDPTKYEDAAFGAATIDAVRGSGDQVIGERTDGHTVIFELADTTRAFREEMPLRRVALRAESVTVSHASDRVANLLDDDVDSRWMSGSGQHGGEWIRVTFDRPIDLARVRLDIQRRSYGDYPREIRIESHLAGQTTVLYEGSGINPFLRSVLRQPLRPAVEIDFPKNQTDELSVYQIGRTNPWFWSVHELAAWERR